MTHLPTTRLSLLRASRRRTRTVCSLLVVVLLATSCGSTDEAAEVAAGSGEPTVLTVWAWDGVFSETLIDEFEQLNPSVDVQVQNSDFDQHHTGMLNAIAAGGILPDVAAVERTYLPDFMPVSAAFTDLGEFGAADIADQYLDWRWDEGVDPNGRIIGLPTDVGGLALAYRTDLFEAAGLPSDPEAVASRLETWDEFLSMGAEFADAGTETYFVDSFDTLFRAHLGQNEFGYVDGEGEPLIDTSVAATWDFAVEAIELELSAGLPQFSPEWTAGFADGSFAALAAPAWMRGVIAGNAPDSQGSWALVPIPGVGGNWGGSQLAVPAGNDNVEIAADFVEFMTNEDAQRFGFVQNGNFPSTPALYASSDVADWSDPFFNDQNLGPLYAASVEALPSQPTTPGQRELDRIFANKLSTVNVGPRATTDTEVAPDAEPETPEVLWERARLEALELIEASRSN